MTTSAIWSREVERAARELLAKGPDADTSVEIAIRASRACEQLVRHLSRLLGATGSRALLKRSLHLASASFPWLARAEIHGDADGLWARLRACIEAESPATATAAFVCLLTRFVELLARLIGDALTARVLHEVWPALFAPEAKESM